eukprot:1161716-Pelagomonas_calceolata.AAC.15
MDAHTHVLLLMSREVPYQRTSNNSAINLEIRDLLSSRNLEIDLGTQQVDSKIFWNWGII